MAVGPLNRSTTGCPPDFNWNYDRVEIIADGVVHSIDLGIVGAVFLHLGIPHFANNGQVTSVAIYAMGLLQPRFRTFSDSLYARARAEWELGTLAIGKRCQERISATGWAW
jgi:hypothetical protein